jgi:uncharacterized membrane protein (UPF0127 family)
MASNTLLRLLILCSFGCNSQQARTNAATADSGGVTQGKSISVELVSDRFEISRGLMCRDRMASDWGMLFFMPQVRAQSFWMKNTLIPLDMVFISEAWQIVGIIRNAEPRTLSGRGVNVPSRYVLELNSGDAERFALEVGQFVKFTPPAESSATDGSAHCVRDQDCTGAWAPNSAQCGPVERCFNGQCIVPPAMTGQGNSETGLLKL